MDQVQQPILIRNAVGIGVCHNLAGRRPQAHVPGNAQPLIRLADVFHLGKLPGDLLADLLSGHQLDDPSVIVGPGVGMDAAL